MLKIGKGGILMTVNTPRAHLVLRYGICSVAAGAKDVLNTLKKEIER